MRVCYILEQKFSATILFYSCTRCRLVIGTGSLDVRPDPLSITILVYMSRRSVFYLSPRCVECWSISHAYTTSCLGCITRLHTNPGSLMQLLLDIMQLLLDVVFTVPLLRVGALACSSLSWLCRFSLASACTCMLGLYLAHTVGI